MILTCTESKKTIRNWWGIMNDQTLSVELRPMCKADAAVLMELNNNKEVSNYVVGNPQTVSLEQQLSWMEKVKNETNTVRLMIVFNEKVVGTVIISSIDYANASGNMSIKLLPEYQGRGIAKRALSKACDLAFDDLKLFCLTANILSYNAASCGLVKSVGFRQDGVLRSRVIKNGKRFDLLAFSYLKTERV